MVKNIRNFEKAREYVRSLEIKSVKAWKEYCKSGKKPEDIPYNPDREYKNKRVERLGRFSWNWESFSTTTFLQIF